MQIIATEDIRPDVDTPRPGQPERSPTLHLSSILKDMLIKMDRKRFTKPLNTILFEIGWAMEHAFSRGLLGIWQYKGTGEVIIHPGEFRVDGVSMSPDAVIIEDILRVMEMKFTRMSCRQNIFDPKFWHYITQLMCYVRAVGTLEGILFICFINGNYSYDDNDIESGPVLRKITLRFTELELEERWEMVVNHAIRLGWLAKTPFIDIH